MPFPRLCLLLTAALTLTACGGGSDGGEVAPVSQDVVATSATTASTPTGDADEAATDDTTETASADAAADEPPSDATQTTEPEPDAPEGDALGEGAVTVLLIGTDSRDPASLEGQADTIMLVHLPADREQVALISLTRDMWVPIPGLGEGKITSAFARGGTDTLSATVSELLGGVQIDHTVQVNFQGFINLTRWLEGFEVDNRHASEVTVGSTGRQLVFEEGPTWLENTDALIYSRQRQGLPLGDLDRTERQRAVIIGMMTRLSERLAADPASFPELVTHLRDNVKISSGLELTDLLTLAPLLRDLDEEDTVSLMVPITGFGTIDGASVNLVDTEQTAALGAALRADDLAGYVAQYGTDYAPSGR